MKYISKSSFRSLDGYTDRSSSGRETSAEMSEAASSASTGTTSSSSRFTSSTPSSQRSAAGSVHTETPRSSMVSSLLLTFLKIKISSYLLLAF